jgi:hypothetical protein
MIEGKREAQNCIEWKNFFDKQSQSVKEEEEEEEGFISARVSYSTL